MSAMLFVDESAAMDAYVRECLNTFLFVYAVGTTALALVCLSYAWIPVALRYVFHFCYVKGLQRSPVFRRLLCLRSSDYSLECTAATVPVESVPAQQAAVVEQNAPVEPNAETECERSARLFRSGAIDLTANDTGYSRHTDMRVVFNLQTDNVTGDVTITYVQSSMCYSNLATDVCYLCTANACEVMFLPCGHGICTDCMLSLERYLPLQCGHCRTDVHSVIGFHDFRPIAIGAFTHHVEAAVEYDNVRDENVRLNGSLDAFTALNTQLLSQCDDLRRENRAMHFRTSEFEMMCDEVRDLRVSVSRSWMREQALVAQQRASTANECRVVLLERQMRGVIETSTESLAASVANLESTVSVLAAAVRVRMEAAEVAKLCHGFGKLALSR